MRVQDNRSLVSVYLWFVLRQLDQHHEDFMESRNMKVGDLAMHRARGATDRMRAAEALAMPLMNLYGALTRAAIIGGMTFEQVREKVASVLQDEHNSISDLADVFVGCFQPPQTGETMTAKQCSAAKKAAQRLSP